MFNIITRAYTKLSKNQIRNKQLWFQYYREVYHIGQNKAERLANKKINIQFKLI